MPNLEEISDEELIKICDGVVKKVNREIIVDWKKLDDRKSPREYNSEKFDKIIDALKDYGILSPRRDGSFVILAGGFVTSIGGGLRELTFTRFKDAEAYAKEVLGGAQYPIEIFVKIKDAEKQED